MAAEQASIPVSIVAAVSIVAVVSIPVQADWARSAIPAGVWTLCAAGKRALTPPVDWAALWALLLALDVLEPASLLALADLGLVLLPELVFLVADECRLLAWVVALPRAWACRAWGASPVLDVRLPAAKPGLMAQHDNPQRGGPELFGRRSSAWSRPPVVDDHDSGWRTVRDSASPFV